MRKLGAGLYAATADNCRVAEEASLPLIRRLYPSAAVEVVEGGVPPCPGCVS